MAGFPNATVHVVASDESVIALLAPLLRLHDASLLHFGSGAEYLRHVRADGPACLLLDLELPDGSGLDVQAQLEVAEPPVIFMSSSGDIAAAVRAMRAGALQFLMKPLEPVALLAAIQEAFENDWLQRHRRALLTGLRERLKTLTHREREVLPLLLAGLKNKQAAWELDIREVTLQVHRGQIMRKMRARSFAELVRMGHVLELCPPIIRAQDSSVPPLPYSWQVCSDRLDAAHLKPPATVSTDAAIVPIRRNDCGSTSFRDRRALGGGDAVGR